MVNIDKKGKDIKAVPEETQERIIFDEFVDQLAQKNGIESIIDRPLKTHR